MNMEDQPVNKDNKEPESAAESNEMPGVQDVKIENHHYVVSIIWKDGKKSLTHFPENGFVVADPVTHEKIGHLSGEEALEILKENCTEYNMEDFSWIPFVVQE
jgi:hypothetical protein